MRMGSPGPTRFRAWTSLLAMSGILVGAPGQGAVRIGTDRPRADPMADAIGYAKLVAEYEQGDPDRAVREIVTWQPDVVLQVLNGVESARLAESGEIVQLKAVLASLPAAVMLHTEAGLRQNWRGSADAGIHWGYAQRLAQLSLGRKQDPFLRSWYHALGLFFLGSYGVRDAISLLDGALERFPDDAAIALALGQAHEALGTFSEGQILSVRPDPSGEARQELGRAEELYRDLLARHAALGEARLRLGRVLQISGRAEPAFAELRRVAATAEDTRLRYLAHLFIADQLRRESRLPESRDEFSQALEAWPGAQAAALGLAEALRSMGHRGEAASSLVLALRERGQALGEDPFRSYSFGNRAEQRRLLEGVKAMARGTESPKTSSGRARCAPMLTADADS